MSTYITSDRLSYFIFILEKNGKSTNTIASYSKNINKLAGFLNGSELTMEQMQKYKGWLKKKGLKQRTINTYLAAANYFCEVMGWQNMKVKLEPLEYEELQNTMCISSSNYNKLVYTALQHDKERLAMMIQVLCYTELRFCELEFLTVSSLKSGFVYVIRNHKKIKIIIPDIIKEDLNIFIQNEGIITGIIFKTKNGTLVNRSNFCKDLRKVCILAGINEKVGSIQHIKNVVIDDYPYYKLKKHI